jgi:AraC-like DNA-binding protein
MNTAGSDPNSTEATQDPAPATATPKNSDSSGQASSDEADQEHHARPHPSEGILLEALANDLTYEEAGKAAGVSTRTVARRLDDPTFAAAVDARRRELAEQTISHIRQLRARRIRAAIDAQQVLMDLLHHDDPKIQLAAARQLHASQSVKHDVDVHERLLGLEGRLEPPGAARPPQGWAL